MKTLTEADVALLHVRIPKFLRAWVLAHCQERGIHPAAYVAALIVADKRVRDSRTEAAR